MARNGRLLRSLLRAAGVLCGMEITPDPAAVYRAAHSRKLMVLTKWRNAAAPACDEFCRIHSVETLSPGLWLTATFLDGSTRRFRPDAVRIATGEEELQASSLMAAVGNEATPV
jgi:hypothetical protein